MLHPWKVLSVDGKSNASGEFGGLNKIRYRKCIQCFTHIDHSVSFSFSSSSFRFHFCILMSIFLLKGTTSLKFCHDFYLPRKNLLSEVVIQSQNHAVKKAKKHCFSIVDSKHCCCPNCDFCLFFLVSGLKMVFMFLNSWKKSKGG